MMRGKRARRTAVAPVVRLKLAVPHNLYLSSHRIFMDGPFVFLFEERVVLKGE
jgi:hypothetical protein